MAKATREKGIKRGIERPSAVDASVADPVVARALRMWNTCVEAEGAWRGSFEDDLRFNYGDPDNGWQWPDGIKQERDLLDLPCITINLIQQHNFQIINSGKLSKTSMTILPAGGGATKESADVLDQLVKRVEFQSSGQDVYSMAREFQVIGGAGYWRLLTRYEDTKSFNQEVYLEAIDDPFTVYLDPKSKLPHGGDSRFGFVWDRMLHEDFEEEHGERAENFNGGFGSAWLDDEYVQVCEMFERKRTKVKLYSFVQAGERTVVRGDMMPKGVLEAIKDTDGLRTREVDDWSVYWTKFAGEKILEERPWVGSLGIPIIRCLGQRTVVDGQIDIKGHTRGMKDAQRMFNYNASASIEHGALQTKAPWTAAAKSIEPYGNVWATANTEHHSVLPYDHIDDDNNPMPPPQRNDPPSAAPAFESGMANAQNQMMMASGQYQNTLGQQGNERTGAAINSRQEQGDVSTYHFRANFESAQIWTAQLLADIFPRIYDTKRVLQIMADDGEPTEVLIDPSAQQAFAMEQSRNEARARMIFNPSMGKYSIRTASGDAGTRRERTVEALTLLMTQAPALTGLVGDLLLRAMNIPEADEAANRLRRMVPKAALGEGPTAQEQALQQQVQQLTALLAKTTQENAATQLKLGDKQQLRDIGVYDAETKRIAALSKAFGLDPDVMRQIIEQLGKDTGAVSLQPVLDANAQGLAQSAPEPPEAPPHPDAQKAPDGNWYLTDPTRVGKYMRLAPLIGKA